MVKETDTKSDISITARYTAYIWHKYGLDGGAPLTFASRFWYVVLSPVVFCFKKLFDVDLDAFLVQRHIILDALIEEKLSKWENATYIEIGCGFSQRGLLLAEKFADRKLHCYDLDLAKVIEKKRRLAPSRANYHLNSIDILERSGKESVKDFLRKMALERKGPLILVTEGLMNYFTLDELTLFWKDLVLSGSSKKNYYLTDLGIFKESHPRIHRVLLFVKTLGFIVGRRLHLHFRGSREIEQYFKKVGFLEVRVEHPHFWQEELPAMAKQPHPVVRIVSASF